MIERQDGSKDSEDSEVLVEEVERQQELPAGKRKTGTGFISLFGNGTLCSKKTGIPVPGCSASIQGGQDGGLVEVVVGVLVVEKEEEEEKEKDKEVVEEELA